MAAAFTPMLGQLAQSVVATEEQSAAGYSDGGALAEWAWLILVVPIVATFLIAFFGKRLPFKGWEVAVVAMGFVALYGTVLFIANAAEGIVVEFEIEVAQIGSFTIEWGWVVDGLSIMMYFLIGVVGLLIFVYALGYMKGDIRFTWFFVAFTLFAAGMLVLVAAPNFIQLIVGWELVGLASYLLIGHYWEEMPNVAAANKAFMVNKVGDAALFIGAIIVALSVGSFRFSDMLAVVGEGDSGSLLSQFAFWAGLLIFIGAMGKSAQVPLHVWLPDAMAGPTPVSALMHAATMVTAGVYLLGRLFPFYLDPTGIFAGEVRTIIIIIGGITLFFVGLLAFVQDDIKRVLAYSTVSQLGYMVAAMGAGAYTAGLFHLFTHAFFKALLFLGAGAVIHAVRSNNMSDMGGLRKYLPYTYWTFILGTLALVGIFPLSGFWSKDEIIASIRFSADATGEASAYFVLVLSILGAFVTAFYMTRLVALTFHGEYKGHAQPHEAPAVMTYPMLIFAFFAVTAGWVNIPGIYTGFTDWVGTRAFAMGDHHPESVDFPLILIITPLALLGIFVAWRIFAPDRDTQLARDRFAIPVLYPLLRHKYYFDDFYYDGVVRPVQGPVARAVYWFDLNVIDGVAHGLTRFTRLSASGVNTFDQEAVDGVYHASSAFTGATGGFLRLFQSGRVQQYAALSFAGAIVMVAVTLFIVF